MILFHTPSEEYGFMSPEDPGGFTVGNTLFTTLIQYIEYSKAIVFQDRETARAILNEHDPFVLRGLGQGIRGYNEVQWNGRRGAVLYRGLAARLEQHPEMISELAGTGEELLVYCDPVDDVLGIRLWKDDPQVQDIDKWRGQNLLGFTLMELRSVYMEEIPEAGIHNKNTKKWGAPPYSGDDPYIYLNYSRLDEEDAAGLAELISELGYPVWYDEHLGTGRIWTGERSRAVAGSMAVVELYTGKQRHSHIECLAREFGDLLGIPHILINTEDTEFDDEEGYIYSRLTDEGFKAKLQKELERAEKISRAKATDTESRQGSFDLVIRYYCSYGEKHGMFQNRYSYKCNLRTREKYFRDGKRVMKDPVTDYIYGRLVTLSPEPEYASDEEVYRAVIWLCEGYELAPVSSEKDYIGTRDDWAFDKHLAELKTGIDPELKKLFDRENDRIRRSREDYPYMDEFEYIDSQFSES